MKTKTVKLFNSFVIKLSLLKFYLSFLIKNLDKHRYISLVYNILMNQIKDNIELIDSLNDIFPKYKVLSQKELEENGQLIETVECEIDGSMPEIIGLCKESKINFLPLKINICKFQDAIVTAHSDIVRIGCQCYWYKYDKFLMYKTIPFDRDLVSRKDNFLFLLKPKIIREVDIAISLVDASGSWSHFLLQYLPKLQFYRKHLEKQNIVILILEDIFPICKKIIEIMSPDHWKILQVKNLHSLQVKNLYYVDNVSWFTDHSDQDTLGDAIFSNYSLSYLEKVGHYVKEYYSIKPQTKRRIYLRRGEEANYRFNLNTKEVDKLLEKYNFDIFYPHKHSIKEILQTFSDSEIIVGGWSSAFFNVIFCEENTKIIYFINKAKMWSEPFVSCMSSYIRLDIKAIPSNYDEDPYHPHSSYSIDINILKQELDKIL